ncbi:hypothetical protein WLU27_16825, partial [Bordetella bronchiseptica]
MGLFETGAAFSLGATHLFAAIFSRSFVGLLFDMNDRKSNSVSPVARYLRFGVAAVAGVAAGALPSPDAGAAGVALATGAAGLAGLAAGAG